MPERKRTFRTTDILAHKSISGVAAAPDGLAAAFTLTRTDLAANKDVNEVWAWSGSGGARQVTFDGSAQQPAFSPAGDRLAFTSDRGGASPQLYVMARELSEGRRITDFAHGVTAFRWGPAGRRIAVIAKPDRTPAEKKRDKGKLDWWTCDRDERRQALWVVPASGRGKPRRVSAPDEHVGSAAWTPDGRQIAYVASPVAGIDSQWFQAQLKVVGADGRRRRTIRGLRGHAAPGPIDVSLDGSSVLVCCAGTGRDVFNVAARAVDLKTGKTRTVARGFDYWTVSPCWLPDGSVLCRTDIGTAGRLAVCRVGSSPRLLETGPGLAAGPAASADGRRVFYAYSEGDRPDELYVTEADGSAPPVALSSVNKAMARVRLAPTETVRWKSGDLGVEGLLFLPTKAGARKPYPLVVIPHGGPYGSSLNSYGPAPIPNVFCAAGYACLMPNFRGSTGYGAEFLLRIVRDWGDGPLADCMAGVDALVRRGVADRRRLAILGGSYGGYLTAWAVGHTNRFRSAVMRAAVTNNISMFGTTDVPSFMLHSAGAKPTDFSDDFWAKQSPLYHAGRVRTPTLVVTGDSDVRVPPAQSHEFYRAMKAAGVETKLVIFPREPHGLVEPRHRLAFARQALAWIDEHTLVSG